MEQNLIQQLIDLVTKAAPELWRIARLQVLNHNVMDGMIGVAFVIVCLIIFGLLKKLKDEDDLEYYDNAKHTYAKKDKVAGAIYVSEDAVKGWKIAGWIVISILALIVLCNFVSIVMRFINPDYYAIEILVGLVK
jgi:hypothetical protein